MKVLLAILLCISMALASAGVTGELRYDCRMSGETNLTECCCAGNGYCSSGAGNCCLPDGDHSESEDCPDSEGEDPCGCCDIRIVASDDPIALVSAAKLAPPVAKLLSDRIDFELAILAPVCPEFYRVPERSPPKAASAPVRIRFCSFLI